MKFIIIIISLFPFTLQASTSCKEVMKDGFDIVATMKVYMTKGIDITQELEQINKLYPCGKPA